MCACTSLVPPTVVNVGAICSLLDVSNVLPGGCHVQGRHAAGRLVRAAMDSKAHATNT